MRARERGGLQALAHCRLTSLPSASAESRIILRSCSSLRFRAYNRFNSRIFGSSVAVRSGSSFSSSELHTSHA